MKIVLTDPAHLSDAAISEIESIPATVYTDVPMGAAEVIKRIGDAELAVSSYVAMTKEVLAECPNLRYLIVPAVGYQGVDLQYANERGITVMNCPTHNSQAVAEHALALLFSVARKIPAAVAGVRQGQWKLASQHGVELAGKQIGIVGYGNIGRRIAAMASGIGMQVRSVDIDSTPDEVNTLLRESDVVCLSLPLTDATRHLIDTPQLQMMKPSAILINISRGPIVNSVALRQALHDGQIAAAGLDVVEGEPLVGAPLPKPDDPDVVGVLSREVVELANLPNVVLSPHMGWNTAETVVRQGEELSRTIRACLASSPINVVN